MVYSGDEVHTYLISVATAEQPSSTTLTCKLEKSRPVTIGRSKENDITLDDKRVSRKHAIIVWDKDHYVLTDFKSRNGTYLNGKRVSQSRINHSDQIKIGQCEFKVQLISKKDMMKKVIKEKIENPSQTGFFGDLTSLTIDEIVQIIHQSQKTGLLIIQSKLMKKGAAELFFQNGEIIEARIDGKSGLDSAYSILQMTEGQFEFSIGVTTQTHSIYDSTMHLLFEAVRLKDEQNR